MLPAKINMLPLFGYEVPSYLRQTVETEPTDKVLARTLADMEKAVAADDLGTALLHGLIAVGRQERQNRYDMAAMRWVMQTLQTLGLDAEARDMARHLLTSRRRSLSSGGEAMARTPSGLLIEAFLETMSAEQGASKHTLAAYGNDLKGFAAFLEPNGQSLQSAERADILAYLDKIAAQDKAASTAARLVSSLTKFYTYLVLEGVVPASPVDRLPRPKTGQALPKYLSQDDVERLMRAVYDMPAETDKAEGEKGV